MLAQAADEEARRLVGDTPYQARTPHTLTSWPRLRASLEEVRTTGVAISEQEYEIGLDSIAVALAWPQENAAINISLPTQLDTPQARRALVQGLRRTARAIIPPHA
jgi:DNA-binding IclR family transcriptional regulator